MKTTSFFMLLACSFCLWSTAQQTKVSDDLSSIQTRTLQTRSQHPVTMDITRVSVITLTCPPPKVADVGFKRTASGAVKMTLLSDASESDCEHHCTSILKKCVAYGFESSTKTCEMFSTLDGFDKVEGWTTTLLRFEGDHPCNEANFIRNFHRSRGDIDHHHPSNAASAKDCCQQCIDMESPGCVAWDYHSGNQNCYLKDKTKELKTAIHMDKSDLLTTGFGCGFYDV